MKQDKKERVTRTPNFAFLLVGVMYGILTDNLVLGLSLGLCLSLLIPIRLKRK